MNDQTDLTLTRRGFLAAGAAAATAVAVPVLSGGSAEAQTPSPSAGLGTAGSSAVRALALDEIQGNILGGFNKDSQALVGLTFSSSGAAQGWLRDVLPTVAPSSEVLAFNASFKAAVSRSGSESNVPSATWVNVAFTHAGLRLIGVSPADLQAFPDEFRSGMAGRSQAIGDTGPNAPTNWPSPFRQTVHAVVILAADRAADLDVLIQRQRDAAAGHNASVAYVQRGATRADQPGHEHFGFRDGISQPGVRGLTAPMNPANPDQGIPGQDLLWPGEFVVGYPRQGGVGAGTSPGPIADGGPAWAVNGSYLVFRRLTQDVAGFRGFVSTLAKSQGWSEDLAGAKIVGRYKSGAALKTTGAIASDPGLADSSLVSDAKVNDFEYGDDPNGTVVPLAAHIRKSYPRDEPTREGGEEDTQTHRILRRGIPFGDSLPDGASATSPEATPSFPNDRGLLFLCYQSSIARQFEFIQRRWINDPSFPKPGAGHDPVVSQVEGTRSFALAGGRPDHVALMQRFVTTTGGDYFFQPSLSALRQLANGGSAPTTTAPTTTAPTTTRPTPPPPTTTPPATRPATPPPPTQPPARPSTTQPARPNRLALAPPPPPRPQPGRR